jgi:hypothetical protein
MSVEPTQKDQVPSDRSKAALYDYGNITIKHNNSVYYSLFGWLVADGWCWFVLREKTVGWLLVAGLF